jgi:hypothetical protein
MGDWRIYRDFADDAFLFHRADGNPCNSQAVHLAVFDRVLCLFQGRARRPILGKVVLLMDWAESKRQSSSYPRALVIAFKTFIYGLAVIVLGISERVFHAYRHAGHFSDAVRIVIDNANLDRFLGCVLLISLLVSAYLAMEEISRAMGKGALFNLFFKAPANTDTSSQGQ